MENTISPTPIVYEDVIFTMWYGNALIIEPWACICTKCNTDLLDNTGYAMSHAAGPSQCCVQGCTRNAQYFITLVGAKKS